MLRRAIDKGVAKERLARAFNVNLSTINSRINLLHGICPKAVELLQDHQFAPDVTRHLRKMKAARQIEAVELMISANSLTAAHVLERPTREEVYGALMSHFTDPAHLLLGATEAPSFFTSSGTWPKQTDFREQMMFMDQKTYLPDDILTKVDRASMAFGLETRVPLLDHRVVEFAWSLPMEFKSHGRQSKWLLRELTHRYLPRELMERPKKGFSVPMKSWLRGPLRDWAEELLSERRLQQEGYFDVPAVRAVWSDFLSGKRQRHTQLWNILMFQAWHGR